MRGLNGIYDAASFNNTTDSVAVNQTSGCSRCILVNAPIRLQAMLERSRTPTSATYDSIFSLDPERMSVCTILFTGMLVARYSFQDTFYKILVVRYSSGLLCPKGEYVLQTAKLYNVKLVLFLAEIRRLCKCLKKLASSWIWNSDCLSFPTSKCESH